MKENPSNRERTPYARALILSALLTACPACTQDNEPAPENDQNPPAGSVDISDTSSDTEPEKDLSMEVYKNDAGVTVLDFDVPAQDTQKNDLQMKTYTENGNTILDFDTPEKELPMKIGINDAGVTVLDFLGEKN